MSQVRDFFFLKPSLSKIVDKDDDSDIENDAVNVGDTLSESALSTPDASSRSNSLKDLTEFIDCEVCDLPIRKSVFEFHRKTHLSTLKTTFECEICKKEFQKKNTMYKHRRRCELMNLNRNKNGDEINDFEQYPLGHSIFDSVDTDYGSGERGNGSSDKEGKCGICKKTMLKGNIKRHMRAVHASELDNCNGNPPSNETHEKGNLTNNQLAQERLYNSPTFDGNPNSTSFTDETSASDDNKFKCDLCENVYSAKDSVRRHKKSAHPEVMNKSAFI